MRFIKLNASNKIIGIREGISIVIGEIQNDIGKLGQIMQVDGTFIDDILVESQLYYPTNTDIAQMISDLQADLIIKGVI